MQMHRPMKSPDPANFTPSAEQQDIFVRAQNIAKTECHTVDSFVVNVYRSEIVAPTEGIVCSTEGLDPDTGTFDLTEKETDIAGPNQNLADVDISYHPSQQDADNDANEITNPTAYQNTTNPQIIYVRVENPDAPDSLEQLRTDHQLYYRSRYLTGNPTNHQPQRM